MDEGPPHGRRTGTLVDWHDDRGFGFIEVDGERRRLFVHVSAFSRSPRPEVGARVMFRAGRDGQGRQCAVDARLARPRRPSVNPATGTLAAAGVAAVALVTMTALTLVDLVPVFVTGTSTVLSVMAFFTYAGDKTASVAGRHRVPENTLHLLGVLGGWPGALVARHAFGHKTRKEPFRTVFWCTVVVHVVLVATVIVLADLLPSTG